MTNIFEKISKEKETLIRLLRQKNYSKILDLLSQINSLYMIKKRDYDRYNICPYNEEVSKSLGIDYVNSSFVKLNNISWIACSEPKAEYNNLFVEFIKKSDANIVLSLINNPKYFHNFQPISGRIISNESGPFLREDKYKIENKAIVHITCLNWHDKDILCLTDMNLLHIVISNSNEKEIIIHCKAGIGRTGTFIMFDALKSLGSVNYRGFVDLLIKLRSQRPYMIETPIQLKFLAENFILNENNPKIVDIEENEND